MKNWLLLLILIKIIVAEPTPIVLWHGMGDTCCYDFSLGSFKTWLERQIPGIYVLSLRIGDNLVEDFETGYFMPPNEQIDYVCGILAKDRKLRNGFNAIGFSQGSQFLRGTIQKCGHQIPRMRNLISLGGQHQGVYGLPHCFAINHKTCDYIRKLLNTAAYADWLQNSLVQATYWHDPLDEKKYRQKSKFLADINNERFVNKTYINNLQTLEHFVMVKFETDSMVQPRESEWFGFYTPGQSTAMQKLNETRLYIKDRLGLKKMDEQGKLVFLSQPGDHLQFDQTWFVKAILQPYLNSTAS